MHSGFGPWGALRLIDHLEAQGNHRFDGLYQELSAKFDKWALTHPAQAKLFGAIADSAASHPGQETTSPPAASTPVHSTTGSPSVPSGPFPVNGSAPAPANPPVVTTSPASGSASVARNSSAASTTGNGSPPSGGNSPDGVHPLIIPCCDAIQYYEDCNCGGATANGASPNPGAPALASGAPTGATGGPPSAPSPNPPAQTRSGPMDSDASLITGEYFQEREVATYQSLDTQNGVDLEYSSLDADALPVVTAVLTTKSGEDSAYITSINVSLTVNGNSQGAAITYDDVSLTDGESYMVQIQAADVSTYATGIYPTVLTVVKNFSNHAPQTETYDGTLMVVNDSSSPYGAGWTVGGLERITVGTSGSTLMLTDGDLPPEEFRSTNGVNYTGNINDPSTLTYNSGSNTYTHTYTDGTIVTFNS